MLTFNNLLSILKNAKNKKQLIPIAKSLGIHHSLLISWLDSFIYIRNIVAHHGRLWNIILTIKPGWLKSPKGKWVNKWENNYDADGYTLERVAENDKILKFYSVLCALLYCLQFINPYHKYREQFFNLIKKYPEVDLYHMGFPKDWEKEDLWN